jgi:hypothetical protein
MRSDCLAMFRNATEMQRNLLQNGYCETGGIHAKLISTRLPQPTSWDEQMAELRQSLGEDVLENEGAEWNRRRVVGNSYCGEFA